MITITLPKWFAIIITICLALDIVKEILKVIVERIEAK